MRIEKNVAMPKSFKGKGNIKHTQFREMEVGDSVFVEGESSADNTAVSARMYGHRSGKKFSTRASAEGVRIWRTA